VADEAAPAAAPTAGGAPSPSAPQKKKGPGALVLLLALVVVAAVVAGVFLLVGKGDDDSDDAGGFERPEQDDVDLTTVTDNDGVITVGIIARWDDVDGRNLQVADGVNTPDLVASEDSTTFLDADSFGTSGIEVTVQDPDVLAAQDLELDASAILDARVDGRNLADGCTNDGPTRDQTVAGFDGKIRRFEGCDGAALVVFAGVDGGRALVIEAHLVGADDEASIDAVLDSIVVQ
jgi:hypothetical protein